MPSQKFMKTLLIDNGSKHTLELVKFLSENDLDLEIQSYENLNFNINDYGLFVLSGSAHTVGGNDVLFKREVQLILSSKKPIIGICFGFELIAHTFGTKISKLAGKEEGVYSISVTQADGIFGGIKQFDVYEGHRYFVSKVSEPLVEMARSKNGVEILKHKTKPIYGFQFHPEVMVEKQQGNEIFRNLISHLRGF
ncbi:hypothetical protein A2886_00165 [candidate division WWE3 bacterium RIFCSPHIGHO2_01_FULL_42_13]|uniref:Glutamine amidotransferase domain-containing protein n=1 Tax=candidate division WWE3 bacterium RIFCSPHIGHO2_01_FULL_42_13 TaxID=1802617 RepID=A0A1F4UT06_UNCKA|nr:MAG: hypothetical protein A2886_00165 [candidate division WWE3 bacterium RIFCSPHIGHO2_01_FULL_42_13]